MSERTPNPGKPGYVVLRHLDGAYTAFQNTVVSHGRPSG